MLLYRIRRRWFLQVKEIFFVYISRVKLFYLDVIVPLPRLSRRLLSISVNLDAANKENIGKATVYSYRQITKKLFKGK